MYRVEVDVLIYIYMYRGRGIYGGRDTIMYAAVEALVDVASGRVM